MNDKNQDDTLKKDTQEKSAEKSKFCVLVLNVLCKILMILIKILMILRWQLILCIHMGICFLILKYGDKILPTEFKEGVAFMCMISFFEFFISFGFLDFSEYD